MVVGIVEKGTVTDMMVAMVMVILLLVVVMMTSLMTYVAILICSNLDR